MRQLILAIVTTQPQQQSTTQPQHCSWVGHEKDCAKCKPTPPHQNGNSTEAFRSLRLSFITNVITKGRFQKKPTN